MTWFTQAYFSMRWDNGVSRERQRERRCTMLGNVEEGKIWKRWSAGKGETKVEVSVRRRQSLCTDHWILGQQRPETTRGVKKARKTKGPENKYGGLDRQEGSAAHKIVLDLYIFEISSTFSENKNSRNYSYTNDQN